MIGVDLVAIHRIKSLVAKYEKLFLKKILTDEEISQVISNDEFNINRIAGFFATKEAISKALGCGIGKNLKFHDIIITKDSKNAPKIRLSNDVLKRFKIKNISVSISHDKNYAISVALIN